MKNKFAAFWGWLLKRTTQQIALFYLGVWLPLTIVVGFPILMHFCKPVPYERGYWEMVGNLAVLVLFIYMVFLPMLFDLLKDHINKTKKQ